MDKKTFTKLSDLVGDTFTINKVWGFQFKMWDNESRRMLTSDRYEKGYRKMYGVDTDKGSLDLSASQVGQMLEAVSQKGVADINGRTFSVKSNGKTGMDIRYFINPTKDAPVQPTQQDTIHEVGDEPINLDSLGF